MKFKNLKLGILLFLLLCFSSQIFAQEAKEVNHCDPIPNDEITLSECIGNKQITEEKLDQIPESLFGEKVFMSISKKCKPNDNFYSRCLENLNKKSLAKHLKLKYIVNSGQSIRTKIKQNNPYETLLLLNNREFLITDIMSLNSYGLKLDSKISFSRGEEKNKLECNFISNSQTRAKIKNEENILFANCDELKYKDSYFKNTAQKKFKLNNDLLIDDITIKNFGFSKFKMKSVEGGYIFTDASKLSIKTNAKYIKIDDLEIRNDVNKEIKITSNDKNYFITYDNKGTSLKCILKKGHFFIKEETLDSTCSILNHNQISIKNPLAKEFTYTNDLNQISVELNDPKKEEKCNSLFTIQSNKIKSELSYGKLTINPNDASIDGFGKITNNEKGNPNLCGENPEFVLFGEKVSQAYILGKKGNFKKFENKNENIKAKTEKGCMFIYFDKYTQPKHDDCANIFIDQKNGKYKLDKSTKKTNQNLEIIVGDVSQYLSDELDDVSFKAFNDLEITRENGIKVLNTDTGNEVNILKLPSCIEPGLKEMGVEGGIDPNKISPAEFLYSPESQRNIKLSENIKTKDINEMFIVSPDWKLVLPLIPIAVEKNIPLFIDERLPDYNDATKYFIEDYNIKITDKFTTKEQVKKYVMKYWSDKKFSRYVTSKEYYYATFGAWFSSDKKINGGKIIPFIPNWMEKEFETKFVKRNENSKPDKKIIKVENTEDVDIIERAYVKSNPKKVIIVMTDLFLTPGAENELKNKPSILSAYYAAHRHAFIYPVTHSTPKGETEKCAIYSAQFANKIDGAEYIQTDQLEKTNEDSLKSMGMNIDSVGPKQGYLLILADDESIPLFASTPWSLGDSGDAVPSCDYEISRSRLEKYRYISSWMTGRIGFDYSISSSFINRAIFYDELVKKIIPKGVFSQQVEYNPYCSINGAFYYLNNEKTLVEGDFNLYKNDIEAVGFVDPYPYNPELCGTPDYANIGKGMINATLFINHAHGGSVPSFEGRGKSTIILNEGCSSILEFNKFKKWSAAYIGSTATITGWFRYNSKQKGNNNIKGITLGEYMSNMPTSVKSAVMLYGDPLLEPVFTKKGEKDLLYKIKTKVRGFGQIDSNKFKNYMNEIYNEYSKQYQSTSEEDSYDPQTGKVIETHNVFSINLENAPEFFPISNFKHTTNSEDEIKEKRLAIYCMHDTKLKPINVPTPFTYSGCSKDSDEECVLPDKENIVGLHTTINYKGSEIQLRSSNIDVKINPTERYCTYVNNLNLFCLKNKKDCSQYVDEYQGFLNLKEGGKE